MIVVDASVLVTALADDTGDGDRARHRLRADPDLHAPHLLAVEVQSVLRRLRARDAIDERRAQLALADLLALPVARYPHEPLLGRTWELRANLTSYDGVYAALAEALGCVLVTADARLGRAPGLPCDVELVV